MATAAGKAGGHWDAGGSGNNRGAMLGAVRMLMFRPRSLIGEKAVMSHGAEIEAPCKSA